MCLTCLMNGPRATSPGQGPARGRGAAEKGWTSAVHLLRIDPMKKFLVLTMLSAFSFSAAAYACDGKDHKAAGQSTKGDNASAKKDSKDKKDPANNKS
jgi:hypothetical protein